MFKKFLPLLLSATALATAPSFDFGGQPDHIEIENRILLKINSKPVSVMDVVRKMDLLFYQQYPDLIAQPTMRFQFYAANWRTVLRSALDDQLILADAEEKHIEVSDGEVREELERMFGPDVVYNIDRLGLGYDEAWQLLHTELVVQRMMGMMVHAKAFTEVHPKELRARYEKYLQENPPEDKWVYQVISLRGADEGQVLGAAQQAHKLLARQTVPLDAIQNHVADAQVNVSVEYARSLTEISESHRAVLETLQAGSYSEPVAKRGVAYIFYLKQLEKGIAIPFAEAAIRLKQEVVQENVVRYDAEYRTKLRRHYGLTDAYLSSIIPDDMKPFSMK